MNSDADKADGIRKDPLSFDRISAGEFRHDFLDLIGLIPRFQVDKQFRYWSSKLDLPGFDEYDYTG